MASSLDDHTFGGGTWERGARMPITAHLSRHGPHKAAMYPLSTAPIGNSRPVFGPNMRRFGPNKREIRFLGLVKNMCANRASDGI